MTLTLDHACLVLYEFLPCLCWKSIGNLRTNILSFMRHPTFCCHVILALVLVVIVLSLLLGCQIFVICGLSFWSIPYASHDVQDQGPPTSLKASPRNLGIMRLIP